MPHRTLSLVERLLAEYARTGALPPITGGEHTPPETPPATPPAEPPKVEFSPEQQAKINDLLAAERKKTEDKIKTDAANKAQAEQEQRERDEAAKRGEFDKVKAELEGKVGTIEAERDALKAEHDALTTYFATQYAAAVEELPEVITAFQPAEDASFSVKADWLAKAQEQAKKMGGTGKPPGNPPNLKPADGQTNTDAARQQARASGRYSA